MVHSIDLKSHYHTLGLTPPATPEQIRESYLQLAQQLHPDKLPSTTPEYLRSMAEQEFLRVQAAYHALRLDPASLALIPSSAGLGETHSWQALLAAACAGSALTLALMTLVNVIRTSEPIQVTSAVDPVEVLPSLPDSTSAQDLSDLLSIDAPVTEEDPEFETSFVPTPDQIERFVTTLREVQPILEATHSRMEQATTPEEQLRIEQTFESAARKMIVANGLTPNEYQQISWAARQIPEIAAAVKEAAQQTDDPVGSPE